MELLKAIYGAFGATYPIASLIIAAILGALVSGGAWWTIGKLYDKDQEEKRVITTSQKHIAMEREANEQGSQSVDELISLLDSRFENIIADIEAKKKSLTNWDDIRASTTRTKPRKTLGCCMNRLKLHLKKVNL